MARWRALFGARDSEVDTVQWCKSSKSAKEGWELLDQLRKSCGDSKLGDGIFIVICRLVEIEKLHTEGYAEEYRTQLRHSGLDSSHCSFVSGTKSKASETGQQKRKGVILP
jgi:hypothetical protein